MGSEQEIFDRYGRTYNAGDVIFHEGDAGAEMFIIQSGKVKITKLVKGGVEKTLVILGPGDFFGEMALLDKSPRSATVECAEDSQVFVLLSDQFNEVSSGNPEFVSHMKSLAAARKFEQKQQE